MTVKFLPLYRDTVSSAVTSSLFFAFSGLFIYRLFQTRQSSPPRWIPYQHGFFYCFGYAWLYLLPFILRTTRKNLSDFGNNQALMQAYFDRLERYEIGFNILASFFYSMAYIGYFCLVSSLLDIHGRRQQSQETRSTTFSHDNHNHNNNNNNNSQSSTLLEYPKIHHFIFSKIYWWMIPVPIFILVSSLIQYHYGIELLIHSYILLWTFLFLIITSLFIRLEMLNLFNKKILIGLSTLLFSIFLQLIIMISRIVYVGIGLSFLFIDFNPEVFVPWLALISIFVLLLFELKSVFLGDQDLKDEELETVATTREEQEQVEPRQAGGVN